MLLKHVGLVGLAVAASLGACWACSSQRVAAPADAGPADGSTPYDAHREAAPITDAQIGPTDGETDADTSWLSGAWDPVPCPGTGCETWVAQDAATSVGPLKWKPCTSGRTGCFELVVDWTTRQGRVLGLASKEPTSVGSDGVPRLLLARFFPEKDYGSSLKSISVAYPLLSTPVFALANVLSKAGIGTWIDAQQTGLTHAVINPATSTARYFDRPWNALSAPTQHDVAFAALAVPANGIPGQGIPNGSTVFQFVFPQGQRIVDVAAGTSAFAPLLDGPTAVATGFIGLRFATGLPITIVRNDASVSVIRNAAANRNNSGLAMDRKRNHLIWAESAGIAPAADSVLYEASFVEKEADLVPHRVTAFDDPGGFGGGYMIANNGVAVVRVSNTRVLVTDLTTGASNGIDADPGKWFLEPIWINDDEVWLAVGTIHGNGADFDSIHRITRASLGPPNIPAN